MLSGRRVGRLPRCTLSGMTRHLRNWVKTKTRRRHDEETTKFQGQNLNFSTHIKYDTASLPLSCTATLGILTHCCNLRSKLVAISQAERGASEQRFGAMWNCGSIRISKEMLIRSRLIELGIYRAYESRSHFKSRGSVKRNRYKFSIRTRKTRLDRYNIKGVLR